MEFFFDDMIYLLIDIVCDLVCILCVNLIWKWYEVK